MFGRHGPRSVNCGLRLATIGQRDPRRPLKPPTPLGPLAERNGQLRPTTTTGPKLRILRRSVTNIDLALRNTKEASQTLATWPKRGLQQRALLLCWSSASFNRERFLSHSKLTWAGRAHGFKSIHTRDLNQHSGWRGFLCEPQHVCRRDHCTRSRCMCARFQCAWEGANTPRLAGVVTAVANCAALGGGSATIRGGNMILRPALGPGGTYGTRRRCGRERRGRHGTLGR